MYNWINNLKKHIWLVVILSSTIALYWPVFKAAYVWDDLLLFVASNELREGNLSWDILSKPILAGASYFRPFVLLSFIVEFNFTDANPAISHTLNLAFFLLNIFLLYILIYIVGQLLEVKKPVWLSIIGSSVYAVHPAMVESAAWVSGRFDLFAATFILLGLVLNFIIKDNLLKIILVSISLLLALGSKEIGFILIPALFVLHMILLNSSDNVVKQIFAVFKNQLKLWLSLFAAFVLYLILRVSALGNIYGSTPLVDEIYQIEGWQIVLPLHTFIFYIKSIIFPFFSSPVHIIQPNFINSGFGKLLSAFAIVLLVGLSYFALIRKNKSALLFGVALIAILPVMHIVSLRILDNIGHDRFLTVPLIFFILGMMFLPWQKLGANASFLNKFFQGLFVLWIIACILTVYSVVPLWGTELKLWSWAYQKQPESKIARASYIAVLEREKQDELLGAMFTKIKNNMDVKEQLIFSGYLIEKQDPEGILYLRGVLESVKPFHNIYQSPNDKEAQQFVNMFDPLAFGYFQLSGYHLIYTHDYQKAYENAQIALWYFPTSPAIIARNAMTLYALGRKDEANFMFERAIQSYHYTERGSAFIERYNFITRECYQKRLPLNICKDKKLLKMN